MHITAKLLLALQFCTIEGLNNIFCKKPLTLICRSGKLVAASKKPQTVETEIKSVDALTESLGGWEPGRDAG